MYEKNKITKKILINLKLKPKVLFRYGDYSNCLFVLQRQHNGGRCQ
jgi:hypothetical protein